MSIPVYIIPTSTPVVEDTLIKFFESNEIFRLVEAPGNMNTIGVDDLTIEANMIINSLADARKRFPDSYVITIKDTSVTSSDADILAALLIDAISFNQDVIVKHSKDSYSETESESSVRDYSCSETYNLSDSDTGKYSSETYIKKKKKQKWQVGYLADWLDRCDLFQSLSSRKDLIKWVRTFSPNGIQANFWSPEGRDIVLGKRPMRNGEFFTPIRRPLSQLLNENIQKGNISAICTSPPFFLFDITLAQFNTDLDKNCFCRDLEEKAPNGAISFFIFLILSVLILAGAWFVYVTWAKHY